MRISVNEAEKLFLQFCQSEAINYPLLKLNLSYFELMQIIYDHDWNMFFCEMNHWAELNGYDIDVDMITV